MIQVEIDDVDKITLPENVLRHLGVVAQDAELSVEFLGEKRSGSKNLHHPNCRKVFE